MGTSGRSARSRCTRDLTYRERSQGDDKALLGAHLGAHTDILSKIEKDGVRQVRYLTDNLGIVRVCFDAFRRGTTSTRHLFRSPPDPPQILFSCAEVVEALLHGERTLGRISPDLTERANALEVLSTMRGDLVRSMYTRGPYRNIFQTIRDSCSKLIKCVLQKRLEERRLAARELKTQK